MFIFTWFAATLRQYPEIAIFLTLALPAFQSSQCTREADSL